MSHIDLLSYRPDDVPACLAAAGLLRVLSGYAGVPVRLSWADTHARLLLGDGVTPERVANALTAMAVERADAPEWALYDLGTDAERWEAKARELVAGPTKTRRASDYLTAGAYYEGGEGERSPLVLTARNMTPGRWARQCAALAQATDWFAHFREWDSDGGGWQGWRSPDQLTRCPAAVWLALEGLSYWTCGAALTYDRKGPKTELARRDILCPGWNSAALEWLYPLPGEPVGADAVRSLVAHPRLHRHATFRRRVLSQGGYPIFFFECGSIGPWEPAAYPPTINERAPAFE